MIIAVASGKGGTGKTSVSVSLAKALADSNKKISLLDCDVEEPNAHLLLECREISRSEFNVKIPSLDLSAVPVAENARKFANSTALQ